MCIYIQSCGRRALKQVFWLTKSLCVIWVLWKDDLTFKLEGKISTPEKVGPKSTPLGLNPRK